jgi:hypothetical protein
MNAEAVSGMAYDAPSRIKYPVWEKLWFYDTR